jgi:hypothetical protein
MEPFASGLFTPAPGAETVSARRRWQVLRQQLRDGHEPCFGTERRHACPERETCPYRAECLGLRAAWR